jgi:hypothetical protein
VEVESQQQRCECSQQKMPRVLPGFAQHLQQMLLVVSCWQAAAARLPVQLRKLSIMNDAAMLQPMYASLCVHVTATQLYML